MPPCTTREVAAYISDMCTELIALAENAPEPEYLRSGTYMLRMAAQEFGAHGEDALTRAYMRTRAN